MILVWKNLDRNRRVFLQFEIPFRIILIFLFTEGLRKTVSILLRLRGYSYITHGNYRRFLLHPGVILGLLPVWILILFLILFESCSLFLLLDAGSRKQKVSLDSLVQLSWKQTVQFIRNHPAGWILYLLVCFPNLYLHFLIWEIDRARFTGIVFRDLTRAFGIPVVAVFLIFCLLLSMIFSQTLPFSLFGKEHLLSAWSPVFSGRNKRQLRSLLRIILLHLRVIAVTVLLYLLTVAGCVYVIRTCSPVYRYVSDTLFYGNILRLIWGNLIGFFGTVAITGYLYSLFRKTEDTCIFCEQKEQASCGILVQLAVLLISGVILLYEGNNFIPDTASSQDYLEVTAHRGGAKHAPENTLAAIQYSIDTKADYAEIDVQETADGEIVLLHDNWLERTTGVRKYIWEVTAEDVRNMDAGSFFSESCRGEKIPTLREVIQACKGKLRLNIEIKANGHNPDIVPKVLAVIEEEDFQSNCVITSMDYSFLKKIKKLNPEITTGYTLSMVYGRVENMKAADFLSVKHTYVNHQLVERAHENGKEICAWTANSRVSIRKVIDAGIDNVITDNPELVRKELLREYDSIPGFISLVKYMLQ